MSFDLDDHAVEDAVALPLLLRLVGGINVVNVEAQLGIGNEALRPEACRRRYDEWCEAL